MKCDSYPYDPNTRVRSFYYKILRILHLSCRSFYLNELYLKAYVLTFYSLISIVPIFAVIFAIAKGFGFEEFLQKQILIAFSEQKDVLSAVMRFAYAFIGHIKGQTIVGLGVIVLFLSVFGLFENLEKSLNTIWRVQKKRGFVRRYINYVMALIFFPVIFIASTSITIFLHSEITQTAQSYDLLKYISTYALKALKFSPYALMCVLFSYLYIFTPNTKICIKPRLIAGILAGAIFQFWQVIYIGFQVYISSYNVIYGSFAALPLFLIWMQINYVIFLFGAELAAHIENDQYFRKTAPDDRYVFMNRKEICLLVLHEITAQFMKGEGSLTLEALSARLGISPLDVREILNTLENAGFVAEASGSLERYLLVVNPDALTVQAVCGKLDHAIFKQDRVKVTPVQLQVADYCAKCTSQNISLKDFANAKNPSAPV